MQRITDGNGQVFWQLAQLLSTCIFIRSIISSLRQSEFSLEGSFSIHNLISALIFRMYGLFQTAFYFGYMALFSGALGIICGTVGYVGTSIFVRKIYSNVKID